MEKHVSLVKEIVHSAIKHANDELIRDDTDALNRKDIKKSTKRAILIAKKFRNVIDDKYREFLTPEYSIIDSKSTKSRIDLIHNESGDAFELKVSGYNSHNELFKDIGKIMVHNLYLQDGKKEIKRLFFITDKGGVKNLDRDLCRKIIESAKIKLGIEIIVLDYETK